MIKGRVVFFLSISLILVNNIYAKEIKHLDDLTVTAQKVEENMQKVPISLTVFDEFDLEDKNIKSVKDIAYYTPNLLLFDSGGFGGLAPTIRGISTDPQLSSSSVSIYIDGIPFSSSTANDMLLTNVQRVEVLKGPQGTLYGKNAEAGIINIITNKPNNEFKGQIGIELGQDNKKEYRASVSGPIIKDKFYVGLDLKHYEKDGFLYNSNLKRNENDRENNFAKLYFRMTPSDNLDISLISTILKKNDGTISQNNVGVPDNRVTTSDLIGYIKNVTKISALKVEYIFDKYKLESITSYKKYIDKRLGDFDFTAGIPYTFHSKLDIPLTDLSQELKLSYVDDKITWITGLFADKSKTEGGYVLDSTIPNKTGTYLSTANDDSFGIFAHVDYKFSDKLSLLGGLRYDKSNKTFDNKKTNTKLSDSFSSFSPKLSLEYDLNEDRILYATISKGYKSGGFYQFAPIDKMSFDDETIINYEIGSKNSFLDNNLIFNTSLYHMDIKDMQVMTAIDNASSYISNAGVASSKGIELELNYKISDDITLFSSLGYNKTIFSDFENNIFDPNTGVKIGTVNYKGNYNPYAPKYNYNLAIQYRDINGYYARADLNGVGDMYLNRSNSLKQDAYKLVNLKLGYESDDYDIYLYGTNIFNKEHDTEGLYDYYTVVSDPREIGIQLSYRF